MQETEKKFALEDTLNQYIKTDTPNDLEEKQFSFFTANFILLNKTYLYIPKKTCFKIILTSEYMKIIISDITWEIKYENIKDFSIHCEE